MTSRPLPVDRVAVRVVGGLAEHRDGAGGFVPAHHAVVGNVGPDQIAARREPCRPFVPASTRPQPLDPCMADEAAAEARIQHLESRTFNFSEHSDCLSAVFHFPGAARFANSGSNFAAWLLSDRCDIDNIPNTMRFPRGMHERRRTPDAAPSSGPASVWNGRRRRACEERLMGRAASPRPGENQTPTMADVAERAGVSAMTVSRALKEGSRVSKATREKIMAAVNELGYVLDQSAGSLSSRKTGFIAAIVPSINNSNFADTARGITDELRKHRAATAARLHRLSVEKEERLIEAMLRRRPEGIILTGGSHTDRARRMLENAGIPWSKPGNLPARPDRPGGRLLQRGGDGAAGQDAGRQGLSQVRLYRRHDLARYARQPAARGFRAGPSTSLACRRAGWFRSACRPSRSSRAARRSSPCWSAGPTPRSVLCVSDLSAFGALMECKRRGMRVPRRHRHCRLRRL